MSEKIVQLNEEIIKGQIKELVRGSVEETLNILKGDSKLCPRRLYNSMRKLSRPAKKSQVEITR